MDTTEKKLKALIIDDDPLHRRLAQVLFERGGFEVSVAQEGSDGVRQAMINVPDVIILDIMMEGLHGFEVCRMLRANSNLRHTAIIVTSGKSYKADIEKASELGADAYVVKPYSPKELIDLAVQHIHKRASLP